MTKKFRAHTQRVRYSGIYTYTNTTNSCQTVAKVSVQMYPRIQLINPGKQSYFRTQMTQHGFGNPTYTGRKSWDDFPSGGNKITRVTHRHIKKSILT